jgi:hypothetical protein
LARFGVTLVLKYLPHMTRGPLLHLRVALLITTAVLLGVCTLEAAPKQKLVPTKRECDALANSICESLRKKNINEFINHIDFDALVDRALEGLPEGALRKPDRDSMRDSFKGGFSRGLQTRFRDVTAMDYVRFLGHNGEAQVLLRQIHSR